MAENVQFEIIKITTFTVGTDIFRGIENMRYRLKAPGFYASREEGEEYPDNIVKTYSDDPKVEGTVSGKGLAVTSLVGLSAASATIAGVNARTGNACTITLTKPLFLDADGNHNNMKPGEQGVRFVATDYAVAEDA